MQKNWTNRDRKRNSPIELIDKIGQISDRLINDLKRVDLSQKNKLVELTDLILRNEAGHLDNKKLINFPEIIISGILIGSIFNLSMTGETIEFSRVTI